MRFLQVLLGKVNFSMIISSNFSLVKVFNRTTLFRWDRLPYKVVTSWVEGIYERLRGCDGLRGGLPPLPDSQPVLLQWEEGPPLHILGGEALVQVCLLRPLVLLSEVRPGHVTNQRYLRPYRVPMERLVVDHPPGREADPHASRQLSQVLGNDRLELWMLQAAQYSRPVLFNLGIGQVQMSQQRATERVFKGFGPFAFKALDQPIKKRKREHACSLLGNLIFNVREFIWEDSVCQQ